jgi:hypothetical protein
MADGVLYVACGDRYVESAAQSARSVRAVTPGIRIAIATDGAVPDAFDEVVPLTEPNGYRAKIVGMIASPFDRTLFLDVDTYAAGDLSELFTLLDAFDVAVAQAPIRISFPLDGVPDAFPELNTGVIAFRRAGNVERFLQAWLHEYDSLETWMDQPSFRQVMYATRDVRSAVLTPEFNLRFWKAGYHNQPVRILHGWGDEATYRSVAALLNGRSMSWRYRAVFVDRTVLDDRARVVGRFPKRQKRFRPKARRARG